LKFLLAWNDCPLLTPKYYTFAPSLPHIGNPLKGKIKDVVATSKVLKQVTEKQLISLSNLFSAV